MRPFPAPPAVSKGCFRAGSGGSRNPILSMSPNEMNPPAEVPTAPSGEAMDEPLPGQKAAPAKPKREPLYFVVLILLIADIVFGLGLAVFAEKVIDFRPMAVVGLGLAGLGLGILAYFVLFGSGRAPK